MRWDSRGLCREISKDVTLLGVYLRRRHWQLSWASFQLWTTAQRWGHTSGWFCLWGCTARKQALTAGRESGIVDWTRERNYCRDSRLFLIRLPNIVLAITGSWNFDLTSFHRHSVKIGSPHGQDPGCLKIHTSSNNRGWRTCGTTSSMKLSDFICAKGFSLIRPEISNTENPKPFPSPTSTKSDLRTNHATVILLIHAC